MLSTKNPCWTQQRDRTIFSMTVASARGNAGSVTVHASTDKNALRENGASCSPSGTIDVAINNNTKSTILLTEVALVPNWLNARIRASATDVSGTYNVSLDPWLNETLRSFVPGPEPMARGKEPKKKNLAQAVTVDYSGEAVTFTNTVVAAPVVVSGIASDKFKVERGSVDRFKITAAITGGGAYFHAGFHVRIVTDQGTTLQSDLLSLYLCTA